MSVQSNRVLRDLLKCQRIEGSEIFVNYSENKLYEFHESTEERKPVKFRYHSSAMISIFNHLSREGFIKDISGGHWNALILTHAGNHRAQSRVSKLLNFLSTSILVPIIVALLTSVAYHLLAYWFPWIKPV